MRRGVHKLYGFGGVVRDKVLVGRSEKLSLPRRRARDRRRARSSMPAKRAKPSTPTTVAKKGQSRDERGQKGQNRDRCQ